MSDRPKLKLPEIEAEIRRIIRNGNPLVKQCSGCPATMFMIPHPNTGNLHPWNADGKSHYATCPKAKEFRRAKP